VSKALTKLVAPASDRLVCHGHTALEEQFLDVAQAQLDAEIPANCLADDCGREPMTVLKRFFFLHHAIVRDRPNNLTTPALFVELFDANVRYSGISSSKCAPRRMQATPPNRWTPTG
jgi:hypothetical protein